MNTARQTALASCLCLMVGASVSGASPDPESASGSNESIDYRYAERLERPPLVSASAADTCLTCQGEPQSYFSFAGDLLTRTRYQGKWVAVLMPPAGTPAGDLPGPAIWRLIDHLDLIYSHFLDLVGEEPEGASKLTVAFVPRFARSGPVGMGNIGRKGVEILDDESLLREVRAALDQDILHGLFVHEMAHNFDVFSDHLSYLPDHPHAWTAFVQPYVTYFSRLGTLETTPDEHLESQLFFWRQFLQEPDADWTGCVRSPRCSALMRIPAANQLWGGFTITIGQLHGPDAIRGAMDFLRDARDRGVPSFIPTEAEDLHVESLASGAGVNLACYVDAWKWHASEELRNRMQSRYGAGAPFCDDLDRDGWTVLAGDCDDFDGLVAPDAAEAANGIDDNCDGVIDEDQLREPEGADFVDPLPIDPPAMVVGRVPKDDRDPFVIRVDQGEALEVELCSRENFDGGVDLRSQQGQVIGRLMAYDTGPTCDKGRFAVPRTGDLVATVRLDAEAADFLSRFDPYGVYSVSFAAAPPWPALPWGKLKKVKRVKKVLRFRVRTTNLSSAVKRPTHLRIWVSGVGFVATLPWSKKATFDWPLEQMPAASKRLSVRAQLLAAGEPASGLSGARFFQRGRTETTAN